MAYIFNEISIGNLTDVQETDSYLYAQDHSNFIARYGYKELTHIYDDFGAESPRSLVVG